MKLFEKLEKASKNNLIGISSITYAEICFGLEKKGNEKLKIKALTFLNVFKTFPFDKDASVEYGKIRAALEKKGKVIGALDMLIAANAKALDAILVTNNEREFRRVDGLVVENWVT